MSRFSRFGPPEDLPVADAWIPGYGVRLAFAVAAIALSLVDFGLTGWLVLGIPLSIAGSMFPQQVYGWGLILFLAAGQLGHHDELRWQFFVLLAGIHLLYVLGTLAPALPWRSWVQPAVFTAPLLRFVAIQLPTQALAVVALELLAPGSHGHRPLTAGAFGLIGAAGLAALALLLLRGSGVDDERPVPSA